MTQEFPIGIFLVDIELPGEPTTDPEPPPIDEGESIELPDPDPTE